MKSSSNLNGYHAVCTIVHGNPASVNNMTGFGCGYKMCVFTDEYMLPVTNSVELYTNEDGK